MVGFVFYKMVRTFVMKTRWLYNVAFLAVLLVAIPVTVFAVVSFCVDCQHRETTIFEEMNKLIKNNIIHVVSCVVFLMCTVGVNKRDSTAIVCRAAQVRERI